MWRTIGTMAGVTMLAAGCAGAPEPPSYQPAYESYWHCAFDAARPHLSDRTLSPHAVAMRAQAKCYGRYERYVAARQAYLRSVVRPSGYDMASQLAEQAAFGKRKELTRRVTGWVAQARE